MNKNIMHKTLLIGVILLLAAAFSGPAFGQLAKTADPVPYAGVFTAGDIWDSYFPTCIGKYYGSSTTDPSRMVNLVRVGNWDRQWSSPTMMYPGWGNQHLPWGQGFRLVVYEPDFSIAEPIYGAAMDENSTNHAYTFYSTDAQMGGGWTADDGAYYTSSRRDHMVYNASFPTNMGINVKMKAQQWTLNHANMNDFILVDFVLTNTGVVDADGDGTAEVTSGHKIDAFTLSFDHELINSMTNSTSGKRGKSGWFTGPTSGFDATPDANNSPWAMPVGFSGPSTGDLTATKQHGVLVWSDATRTWTAGTVTVPAPGAGKSRLGVTMNSRGWYQDIYHGYTFLGAKQGDIIANGGPTGITDKLNLFGFHPIGEGKERGWYMNCTKEHGFSGPRGRFLQTIAQYFVQGDKAQDYSQSDLHPDTHLFSGGTADDILSFVPKTVGSRGRPTGSLKYTQDFSQVYETDWKDGFNIRHQFDGNQVVSVGPFSLDVGETMSISFVTYANFRLAGIRRTLKTARWVWANDYNVPQPPAAPDMKLEPSKATSLKGVKINVKWDNAAESDADFAGYKIYRVTATPLYDTFEEGLITMNHYHEQTTASPTSTPAAFKDPAGVTDGDGSPIDGTYKDGIPDARGPYHLVANIPKAQLSSYLNSDSDNGTYKYVFKDTGDLIYFGFTYWYYVAAYDNESGTIDDVPFTSLESHKVNVNGADGVWHGTYGFAYNSAYFPKTPEGQKAIGASFVLNPPQVSVNDVSSQKFPIAVRPNPYKKQALHDVDLQHKLLFYNLAPNTKITILDISGQIIDVLDYKGEDVANGGMFWDMFSKDGIEVTSGLYIYVAELSDGYKQTGYFSIMR